MNLICIWKIWSCRKAVSFTGSRSFSSANQTVAVSVRCCDEAAESGWVQQPANEKTCRQNWQGWKNTEGAAHWPLLRQEHLPQYDAKWRASTSARRCSTRRKFRRYGLWVTNYKRVTGKFPVELDLHHQIRCLSDYTTPFLLNKQNPEHRLKKQSVLRVYWAAAGVEISWFLLP